MIIIEGRRVKTPFLLLFPSQITLYHLLYFALYRLIFNLFVMILTLLALVPANLTGLRLFLIMINVFFIDD